MRASLRGLTFFVLAGLLGACPADTSTGRAYRCTPGGPAAQCQPWVCRLDGYCHDPAVGEPLDCASDDDCGGQWFCGKDARCHDPSLPGPLPCDTDSQCAGGWRCNTEGTCVDPGPPAPATSGRVERLVLLSPTLSQPRLVSVGPTVLPGPNVLHTPVAMASGGRVEFLSLSAEVSSVATSYSPWQGVLDFQGEVVDVSLSTPFLAVTLADAGTFIGREEPDGGAFGLFSSSAPARFWPLSVLYPDDGLRPFAVLAGNEVRVVCEGLCAPMGTVVWNGGAEAVVDVSSTGMQPATPSSDSSSLLIPLVILTKQRLVTLYPAVPRTFQATPFVANSPGFGTLSPVALRATPEGFAVAFERRAQGQREPETLVAVGAWESRGDLPVPEGSTAPDGGVLTTELLAETACPASEQLRDFALIPPAPPNAPVLSVEVVCADRQTGQQRLYRGSPLRLVAERGAGPVDGRTSGVHAWVSPQGQLALGSELIESSWSTLGTTPDWLTWMNGILVARSGSSFYRRDTNGLFLSAMAHQPEGIIERVAESETDVVALFRQGTVLRFADRSDAGSEAIFLVRGQRTSTSSPGAWHFVDETGTELLVAALGDGVFAGARDAGLGSLDAVTRPAPGFDVSAMDVTRRTDAGVLEGWALANARLFHLVARNVNRWSSTEVPLTGVDPLAVWYEGTEARLATTDGVVLSLPQRLPVSEALGDGVTSVVGACGTALALRDGELWQLGASDGGLRAWLPVPADAWRETSDGWAPAAPRAPEPGRLYRAQGRVMVASFTGLVYELRLTDCPPR